MTILRMVIIAIIVIIVIIVNISQTASDGVLGCLSQWQHHTAVEDYPI
jgi:hypothetical protein